MKPIILMGESGAGKSTAGKLFVTLFHQEGFSTEFTTSKEFLGEVILRDAQSGERRGNNVHTRNQILFDADDATTTEFGAQLLNGLLLNEAHYALLQDTATLIYDSDTVHLREIANGPKIYYPEPDAEPAHQTAEDFFNWMRQLDLVDHAIVWEFRSPYGKRVNQNRTREIGVIPDDVFAGLYPDGGHCTDEHAELLGNRYHLIDNTYHDSDSFLRQVKSDFYEHLLPHYSAERNR